MIAGFIGLGTLGSAMVRRLAAEGIQIRAWNRTPRKADVLPVEPAPSPAVLVSGVEAVFLNLFDSDAVEQVLTGPDGVLAGSCCGKTIIDTSTNHPRRVLKFHRMVDAHGARYLEAPVLGSVGPALQGALTMLVSGDLSGLNAALPYVEKLCSRVFHLPEPGTATRMKLVNNLVLGTFMGVLGDAVSLGEQAGIPRERVVEILGAGGGNSAVLNGKKEKLLRGDFSPQFSSEAIMKDLGYLGDLCRELGTGSAFLGPLRALYGRAVQEGLGKEDFSAVYRIARTLGEPGGE